MKEKPKCIRAPRRKSKQNPISKAISISSSRNWENKLMRNTWRSSTDWHIQEPLFVLLSPRAKLGWECEPAGAAIPQARGQFQPQGESPLPPLLRLPPARQKQLPRGRSTQLLLPQPARLQQRFDEINELSQHFLGSERLLIATFIFTS